MYKNFSTLNFSVSRGNKIFGFGFFVSIWYSIETLGKEKIKAQKRQLNMSLQK